MARPDGMVLTRITFGTAATIITGTPLAMRVTFTPTTDVIWAATGDVFVAFDETIPAASSGRGQVWLPNPDQNGFVDGAGNTIRNFAYKVTAVYTLGGAVVTRNTKYVTWTATDVGPIDLDLLIPVNKSPAVTVYIPDSWSAQVAAAQASAQSAAASLAQILATGPLTFTNNADGTLTTLSNAVTANGDGTATVTVS